MEDHITHGLPHLVDRTQVYRQGYFQVHSVYPGLYVWMLLFGPLIRFKGRKPMDQWKSIGS